jgi:hypothetical protein
MSTKTLTLEPVRWPMTETRPSFAPVSGDGPRFLHAA